MSDKKHDNPNRYVLEQEQDISTNLDPELQKAILQARSGLSVDAAIGRESADGKVLIDVVAKLRDPNRAVTGLNVVRVIGDIVTGMIDINDVDEVRADPNIVSLKAARRVRPTLKFSIPEVLGSQTQLKKELPLGSPDINGAGVIVGIVDYGCDFVHNNFRRPDGTTRLLYLWDQGIGIQTAISPAGFQYGREFNAKDINDALKSGNPYQSLAYQPGSAAHGTHVMDISAGNGRATDAPGMAPQADIVFVQLSASDFSAEENFGNSRHLLEAIDYIFEKSKALEKSAVINLSLGTNGGPHDGSNPVEQAIDHLLETPGRAVVIAASNSWQDRIHASGRIMPGQKRILKWELQATDLTGNEVEVWYGGESQLNVTLVDPLGAILGPFPVGTTTQIKVSGQQVGVVFHRQRDPNNGDNQIDILLNKGLPGGQWLIVLGVVGTEPVDFHAWIERDDAGPSRFSTQDSDSSHTIGSISCGRNTVVVGSYDATVPGKTISYFSAEGPTRDGRQKPEISAPGHGVVAARALSQSTLQMSGTSMAAPHVTGLIALLMHAAPHPLSIKQIREAISRVARREPPLGNDWQPRYGAGRISALATLRSQLSQAAPPLSSSSLDGEGLVPNDRDMSLSFEQMLISLVRNAKSSRLRLKLEIEVEPCGSHGISLAGASADRSNSVLD
jgi:subtilisin family serine protease